MDDRWHDELDQYDNPECVLQCGALGQEAASERHRRHEYDDRACALQQPPENCGHRFARRLRFDSISSIILRNRSISASVKRCRSAKAMTSGAACPAHSSSASSRIRSCITSWRVTAGRNTNANLLRSLATYPFRSSRCSSVITVERVHCCPSRPSTACSSRTVPGPCSHSTLSTSASASLIDILRSFAITAPLKSQVIFHLHRVNIFYLQYVNNTELSVNLTNMPIDSSYAM